MRSLIILPLLVVASLLGLALTNKKAIAQQPVWEKMPLLSREAATAGVFPGGEGGQWPRDIVVAPSDPGFLLLAIDVGGLYRSLDGGKHWQQASVGWNARGANAFAIDPRNPDRVIGVAGNSLNWNKDWGQSPHGVYLSTNKAASWKQVMGVLDGIGGAVAYDPSSFNKAKGYCLRAYYASNTRGLFRSEDGGATWSKVSDQPVGMNLEHNLLSRLSVHPTRGLVYLGGKGGLFKSEDQGATFTKVQDGDVWGLAVTPRTPDNVYLSGADGLLLSRDAGKTWSPLRGTGVERHAGSKPIQNVTVSPADPKRMTCWVEGDNWQWVRYISHDGGATFAPIKINKGLAPLPFNVRQGYFAWHPKDPAVAWGIGGDWVTKSTDGGKTFTWSGNGYSGVMLGGLFNFSTHEPDTVFLAFQDYNGAFTTDGGKTWNYRDVSGKGWGGYCYGGHAVDREVMWYGDAASWGDKRVLRLSHDGGTTWTNPSGADGKPLMFSGPDVSFSDPTNKNILFASQLRSEDRGKSWLPMQGCEGVYTADPLTKALYGKNGNTLVRSTSKGATWTKLDDIPGGNVSDIARDHMHDRIYVASEERLKVWEKGVWRTIGTPQDQYGSIKVTTVAVDPNTPSVIYVGGPRNIYASFATVCRSTDGGVTWTNLTVNTPLGKSVTDGPHEVAAIRVHPKTGYAWVNGQCYGMWRIAPPRPGEKGLPAARASAPRAPTAPEPTAQVVAATAATTPLADRKPIVLLNGSMTSGNDLPVCWDQKWVGKGTLSVTRDVTMYKEAPASLRLESIGGPAMGQGAQVISAPAGAKVTVRGFVRCRGDVKVNVAVQAYTDQWTPISFQQVGYAQGDTEWTVFEKQVTLPEKTARFGVVLLLDGDGKAWLDEVKLMGDGTNNQAIDTSEVIPPPEKQDPTEPFYGYWPDYPRAWMSFHTDLAAKAKQAKPTVVFLGDSITQGWGNEGKVEWEKRFVPLGVANLGIGGDKTSQILWRLQNGVLDGLDPKLVVLAIGVNNLWRNEYGNARIAEGITRCVASLRARCPNAKVLVIGIFPTQQNPKNGLRATIKEINALTAKVADGKKIRFMDFGEKFLESDGSISKEVMPDFLHLSPKGYSLYAVNLEPLVKEMLR